MLVGAALEIVLESAEGIALVLVEVAPEIAPSLATGLPPCPDLVAVAIDLESIVQELETNAGRT